MFRSAAASAAEASSAAASAAVASSAAASAAPASSAPASAAAAASGAAVVRKFISDAKEATLPAEYEEHAEIVKRILARPAVPDFDFKGPMEDDFWEASRHKAWEEYERCERVKMMHQSCKKKETKARPRKRKLR